MNPLVKLLEERSTQDSSLIAHVSDERSLTYADWWNSSCLLADQWRDSGVAAGDVLALKYSLSQFDLYAAAYMAAQIIGAVAVPIDSHAPMQDQEKLLQAAQGRWLICATGDPVAQTSRVDHKNPRFSGEQVSEVLFTSGTTGSPIGVVCRYDEVAFEYSNRRIDSSRRGVELHSATFGSNYAQEMLRGPVLWGSKVVTVGSPTGSALRGAVEKHSVNTLRLTPSVARALVRQSGAWSLTDYVRQISVSSAYSPPELLQALQEMFTSAEIVNQYSLTESGRAKLKHRWGVDPAGSLGRPVEGTEVRIASPEGGSCGFGQLGEIQLRHNAAPARRALRDDVDSGDSTGWVSTGDIGFLSEDGLVHLHDRAKDLVHVGGVKVSPLEVERAISELPGVDDVAVCGGPHRTLGEVVVAFVVTTSAFDRASFWSALGLSSAQRPGHVHEVGDIPRNRSGKVVRSELRTLHLELLQGAEREAPDFSSDDPRVASFLSFTSGVLDVSKVVLSESWFSIGGDSISALETLAFAEDEHGVILDELNFITEAPISDILADFVQRLPPGQHETETTHEAYFPNEGNVDVKR